MKRLTAMILAALFCLAALAAAGEEGFDVSELKPYQEFSMAEDGTWRLRSFSRDTSREDCRLFFGILMEGEGNAPGPAYLYAAVMKPDVMEPLERLVSLTLDVDGGSAALRFDSLMDLDKTQAGALGPADTALIAALGSANWVEITMTGESGTTYTMSLPWGDRTIFAAYLLAEHHVLEAVDGAGYAELLAQYGPAAE